MKKQPEITEKTRDVFINVFCELYIKKPIERISVKEIADIAGYNRSTFYEYFSDIYELLEYIENDLLNYIKEELINKNSSTISIENALNCFENKNHILYMSTLLSDYGSFRFLERLKSEIPIDEIILNYTKDDSLTPYLTEFYITTALSLFRLWIRRNKDLSIDELSFLAHNLFVSGMSYITGLEKNLTYISKVYLTRTTKKTFTI